MIDNPHDARPPLSLAGRRFDGFTFASHLSGWAFGAVLLLTPCLFILPRYEPLLAEYRAEVPQATRYALAASRWVRHYGLLLVPVAVAHSVAVAAWYPRAGLARRRLYRLALTLAACALFGFVILALFLPIASINRSLLPAPK
jgi:hypothetical protein